MTENTHNEPSRYDLIHPDLLTMLILPEEEDKLTDALRAQLGKQVTAKFADSTDAHAELFEQWAIEHPGRPVGDRKARTLSVEGTELESRKIAEAVIDIITPHARKKDAALKEGRTTLATVDEIPWSAHYSIWEKPGS